eukprot:Lankesteria_metandrocarpae@DN2717_c1_g1_i1.p1
MLLTATRHATSCQVVCSLWVHLHVPGVKGNSEQETFSWTKIAQLDLPVVTEFRHPMENRTRDQPSSLAPLEAVVVPTLNSCYMSRDYPSPLSVVCALPSSQPNYLVDQRWQNCVPVPN